MSYDRIGNIIYIKELNTIYPLNCSAVYLISKEGRDKHRVYIKPKLIYINKNFRNKNSNMYKLTQNEVLTLHKENNYYFYLNVLEVYFSTRYSHFRHYLSQIIFNKFVLVLGDGVGPFSIYLAKNNNFIIGYDYNPLCLKYAIINARINKINNYIHFTKNCNNIVYNCTIDCIVSIMPLQILSIIPFLILDYKIHYVILLLSTLKLIENLNKLFNTVSSVHLMKEYNRSLRIYLIIFEKLKGYLK
jgi:tRNA G37 N-methylase Trm5